MKATNCMVGPLLAVGLAACAPSSGGAVTFGTSQSTQYLNAGKYAVRVDTECGNPVETVAGQINGGGSSYPLLNGTPLTLPRSGPYSVVDPVENDLMGNIPACALALTVALTPLQP